MRVLVFAGMDLTRASGSPGRARLLCEGLRHKNVDLALACLGAPDTFAEQGISVYRPEPDASWVSVLQKAASEFHPDWIYGITEAGADFAAQVAGETGCKLAYDIHGLGIIEILDLGTGYGSRRARLKTSLGWLKCVARANLISVANPTLVGPARFLFPRARVVPLEGMVDTQRFSPTGGRAVTGKDPHKLQVLYIGSLYKWQGVGLYLDAVQRLEAQGDQRFEFNLIGSAGSANEGDLYRRIQSFPGQLNYRETVPFDQVPDTLRGADIVVVPRPRMLSAYFAFPQKISEFMASGRCIVATDLAPHRWALQNPACGVLCPATAGGIARAIERAADPGRRAACGGAAREKALALFSNDRQAEKVIRAFGET